jgi:cellulose synthase (UDP-forming)
MLHFFSGVPRLVFLLAPVAYLCFGRHVFNALPLAAVAYGLPHLAHSTLANARLHGRFRHSFWSEVYETALAPYLALPTTIALLAPGWGRFNVTAKGGRIPAPFFDARIAAPYLLLVAANLAALGAAGWRLAGGTTELDALGINVAWALHNLVILAATLAAACERREVRASPRVAARVPVRLRLGDGTVAAGETEDVGRDGARISAIGVPRLFRGERLAVSLRPFPHDRAPIAAEVALHDEGGVRVRFLPASLEEEARIVRAVFSRADAWLAWSDRPRDRPLRALGAIARSGAVGLARAGRLGWAPAASSAGPVAQLSRSGGRP